MTPHRRGKITLVGIGFRIFDSPVWGTITFSQSDLFEPSLNVGGGSLKTKFNFFIKKFCVFNLFSIRNFKSFRDSMLLLFQQPKTKMALFSQNLYPTRMLNYTDELGGDLL